jgi:hypothetical protein
MQVAHLPPSPRDMLVLRKRALGNGGVVDEAEMARVAK